MKVVRLTCRMKSWTSTCSDTCEPMTNRRRTCFSTREISSWSSRVVNPSMPIEQDERCKSDDESDDLVPANFPEPADERVDT